MIEEQGRVVAESGDSIWVQTVRQSTCQSCSARKGCGQKLIAEMSKGKANQVQVLNTLGARTGDEVIIGIDEAILLRASLLVYLLPLLAMIVAAVVADSILHWPDVGVGLCGLSGLGLGFLLVRRFQNGQVDNPTYAPQLLRVQSTGGVTRVGEPLKPESKQIVS
ncbi:SoxR reducing system RseC family protein [Marinobacteraceae bacterium S3BR75-40.1]